MNEPVVRCCPQLVVKRHEAWCPVHGTRASALPDYGPVEEPSPVRRRDLAAKTGDEWTPEEDAWLTANKDLLALSELAEALSRTPQGVMNRLWKTGRHKRRVRRKGAPGVDESAGSEHTPTPRVGWVGDGTRGRKRWTVHEDALLLDYGAEVLKRRYAQLFPGATWRAVVERRRRLLALDEWPLRESDGLMTVGAVARAYGCPRRRVQRLIASGVVAARRAPWGRVGDWRIEPSDCEAPEVRSRLMAGRSVGGRPVGSGRGRRGGEGEVKS